MKHISEFFRQRAGTIPISQEVFNYLVWSDAAGCYITMGISPVGAQCLAYPFSIRVLVGSHFFAGITDQPVFLVASGDPACSIHSLDQQEIEITSEGTTQLYTYFPTIGSAIEDSIKLKIEKGKLYARDLHSYWEAVHV